MPDFAPPTPSSNGTTSPVLSPSSSAPAAPPAFVRAYGEFIFRHRNNLVPLVALSLVVLTRPRPWLGSPHADALLDTLGVVVSLAGQSLRVLVIGLAYIRRGGINKRIAADHLVTTGIFAHCRHPLYVGNFLLLSGLLIIWNSPVAYLVGLGVVGFSLYAMASAEEAFLYAKFGAQYAAYCARVNRFVPSLRGLRATLAQFRFDWRRVIRKEYGTTFSWTTTVVVLIVLERWSWGGAAGVRGIAPDAALAWLCLAALWGTARWMKKTRRLISAP